MSFSQPAPRRNDYLNKPMVYQGLFSPQECAQIRNLPFLSVRPGRVYAADGTAVDREIRRATSRVIEPWPAHTWIFERVKALLESLNRQFYQFALSEMSPLQVLEYTSAGFYDWHTDLGEGEISTRKLSLVVFLSARADYAGGRLQIERPEPVLAQEQGTAVVFPAYMLHRVEPVTDGSRWTLVAWAHGDAFR